jgi:hypothetical protein
MQVTIDGTDTPPHVYVVGDGVGVGGGSRGSEKSRRELLVNVTLLVVVWYPLADADRLKLPAKRSASV